MEAREECSFLIFFSCFSFFLFESFPEVILKIRYMMTQTVDVSKQSLHVSTRRIKLVIPITLKNGVSP